MNKECKNCGNDFDLSIKWSKQIYCCRHCQQEFQYKEYIKRWLNDKEDGIRSYKFFAVSQYIRRWLFEKYTNACSNCGWNKLNLITNLCPLEIHHKNGDCSDNRPENLSLLCPNCHSLTPNNKNLNKNSKRRFRINQANLVKVA